MPRRRACFGTLDRRIAEGWGLKTWVSTWQNHEDRQAATLLGEYLKLKGERRILCIKQAEGSL